MTQLITPRLSAELMRRTKGYAFTDLAYYIPTPDTTTLDEYGQPTASTERVPVTCSFTNKPGMVKETWGAGMDIENVEAEIRFTNPTPTKGGKIIINKMFGEAVGEKTYEIIGIQDRGAFGFVCALKSVSI